MKINHAKVTERIQVVRTFGKNFLILLFSGVIFPLLETLVRRARDVLEIIWHVRFELNGTVSGRARFIGGSFLGLRFRDLHGVG